jgi:hypothetical protein
MGWGAGQGITNNLAGRPLGRGFVLWAVLCGHAPLPERFCVWAAFCGAVLLITLWSALPLPSAYVYLFFFQVFSSLFHFESPNFGRNI